MLAEPPADGRVLLVGVGARVLYQVDEMLSRALWVTLPPMLLLALVIGWIVSRGALRRIAQVHESSRRIMAGQLNERLPTRGIRDVQQRTDGAEDLIDVAQAGRECRARVGI
ncbi:MAG: hypothetical protein ACRETK_08260 [Steroidobacteraceae bacterium]